MEVSPLADHVDFKEHYIAFVDLESFGIERLGSELSPGGKSNDPEMATIQELKETSSTFR